MEWLTTQTEYEGTPLLLRIPNYKNIWEYQSKYPQLISITHIFDFVKENGLPTSEYNKSLFDFDNEVVNIFQGKNNGIIFSLKLLEELEIIGFLEKIQKSFLHFSMI